MTGVFVLVGTLVVTTAVGMVMTSGGGRVRGATAAGMPSAVRAVLAPDGVTLVQLSTTFCAPCRHTRVLLADLAARTDGLHHAELDLTGQPELAGELAVLRTPTTLAVGPGGTELLRVRGVPKRDELLTALRPHLPSGPR